MTPAWPRAASASRRTFRLTASCSESALLGRQRDLRAGARGDQVEQLIGDVVRQLPALQRPDGAERPRGAWARGGGIGQHGRVRRHLRRGYCRGAGGTDRRRAAGPVVRGARRSAADDRGAAVAARIGPGRDLAVRADRDRVGVAEALAVGREDRDAGEAGRQRVGACGGVVGLDVERVGVVLEGEAPGRTRGAATASAGVAPASRRCSTWTLACGWPSAPIAPNTDRGRPSSSAMQAMRCGACACPARGRSRRRGAGRSSGRGYAAGSRCRPRRSTSRSRSRGSGSASTRCPRRRPRRRRRCRPRRGRSRARRPRPRPARRSSAPTRMCAGSVEVRVTQREGAELGRDKGVEVVERPGGGVGRISCSIAAR